MDRHELDTLSSPGGPSGPPNARAQQRVSAPDWQSVFPSLLRPSPPLLKQKKRELGYIFDLAASRIDRLLCIEVVTRTSERALRLAENKSRPIPLFRPILVSPTLIEEIDDPADVAALTALLGASSSASALRYFSDENRRFWLSRRARELIVPILGRTGRCYLRRSAQELEPSPLSLDMGEPWQLRLKVRATAAQSKEEEWQLTGALRRGEVELLLTEAELVLDGGMMLLNGTIARYDDSGASSWLPLLRQHGVLRVPKGQERAFLEQVYSLPHVPPLDLLEGCALVTVSPAPTPHLHILSSARDERLSRGTIMASLLMDYDRFMLPVRRPGEFVFDGERHRLIRRDGAAEEAAKAMLASLSWKPLSARVKGAHEERADVQIAPRHFAKAVHALVAAGFKVSAKGKLYRNPGAFKLSVTSGIDWFDLEGACDFEGVSVSLPALLSALRRREPTVVLDDGTLGVLPEEWLSRYGMLTELGSVEGDHIRFQRAQVSLLDALLAAAPAVSVDVLFEKARAEQQRFESISPAFAPESFHGELRPYQREGLGWLKFLERFGFGGCLADDMGLGKTVQVLALLASRKEEAPTAGPSLVVAPRSLIFNWKSEAARFTPALRVLDHTGSSRVVPEDHWKGVDLVLTTYGTLRRDVEALSAVAFDYVVLDEAQTIKNSRSDAAKAARLMKARHRLALSGTPVENHLGELWSLFEFLNPGILGRSSVFKPAMAGEQEIDPGTLALLGKALRPFLLRRTKAQVARELPARLETTVLCELEAKQRSLYEDLRLYYQASLKKRILEHGLDSSKIHVLEALLRLRQAACHPGLIDPKRRHERSAKLDALFAELSTVAQNGHKALVFSQFTSMLSIVRERLDGANIAYEYLDGTTRDRQSRVLRFQSDPSCSLFLLSLKAGGLGLNLTAADYVFLLDPWWNPAAEAQAIDRAHRIGQDRAVFAYRLIVRDTIEERIAELSQKKRKLAESVITEDRHVLSTLSAEDLDLLLS